MQRKTFKHRSYYCTPVVKVFSAFLKFPWRVVQVRWQKLACNLSAVFCVIFLDVKWQTQNMSCTPQSALRYEANQKRTYFLHLKDMVLMLDKMRESFICAYREPSMAIFVHSRYGVVLYIVPKNVGNCDQSKKRHLWPYSTLNRIFTNICYCSWFSFWN